MTAPLASESIVEAGKRPVTRSLNHLLEEYGFETGSLKGLGQVLQALDKYGITLDPAFDEAGDLDALRTLKARREDERLQQEIAKLTQARGEDYGIELKASIRIDTKNKIAVPGRPVKEYILPVLETKLAQEICAFLNRDGGTIYLGIQNDNTVCGCQDDFDAFDGQGSNQDKCDLLIKRIVEKNFVRPNKVLSRIHIEYVVYEDKPVVILRISKTESLAFLKKDCGSSSQLYMRVGTSAIPIEFQSIEDYYTVAPK